MSRWHASNLAMLVSKGTPPRHASMAEFLTPDPQIYMEKMHR